MKTGKRKLSKKQREALRRRQRMEAMRTAVLALLAVVVCIAAAAFVLRPDPPDEIAQVVASRPTPTATVAPTETTVPDTAATPAPTEVPAPESTETPAPEPTATAVSEPTAPPEPALRSVRLRAVGDIMCTEGQLGFAKKAGGGSDYDFTPQFALIADALADADCTIANLETTIGRYEGMDYSGYPAFNSPESLLEAIAGTGIDVLSLANNHMLDRWFDGLKNTVACVEACGFDHVGAYRSREERAAAKVVEVGGVRIGLVAYTQSANGQEAGSDAGASLYGVPFLASADIEGDIRRLREAGAEVVVACVHWGDEYKTLPNAAQQQYATRIAQAGADVILGGHPHVLQPARFLTVGEGESARDVLLAYSLGNFISTQNHSGTTDASLILEFTLREQPDGGFAVEDVGFLPTYCWKHDDTLQVVASGRYLDGAPAGMDSKTYRRMCATYEEITRQFADFALLES